MRSPQDSISTWSSQSIPKCSWARSKLHVRVVRPAAALGGDPDDVLPRILDVAGLAVHAVLRVDLQPGRAVHLDELVDLGRAVALLGAGILGEIHLDRNGGVLQRQVNRLVLVVVGVRDEHRRQPVEGQSAVRLGVLDGPRRAFRHQCLVVRMRVMQRPRRPAAKQHLVDADHERAGEQALRHPRLEVARAVQLLVQPARAERLGISTQFVVRAALLQRLGHRFGREHARLDGAVAALDARGIEEAGLVADQCAAGKHQPGQRLQAARGDRARAVGDPFAALEEAADRRMGLEALEFLERRKVRVGIAQPDHETHGDLALFEVIEERAAVDLGLERPARGVDDQARPVRRGLHLPQLLQPDAVNLRIGAFAQAVLRLELPAEVPAAAFGKEGVLALHLHAGLVGLGLLALAVDADIAGGHAFHRVLVDQHFGGGKAGKNLHAQRLGLLREPAAHVAQADHVVAVVLEALRQQRLRGAKRLALGEEQEAVLAHRRVQRRALRLPARNQLVERARIHDGSRQDMRAHFRAFLEHADRDLAAQLLHADRGGEARGTGADDDHVVLHRFAGHAGIIISADGAKKTRAYRAHRAALGRHGCDGPRQQYPVLPLHGAGAHRLVRGAGAAGRSLEEHRHRDRQRLVQLQEADELSRHRGGQGVRRRPRRVERAHLLRALDRKRALRRRRRGGGVHRHAGAEAGAHTGKDTVIAASIAPLWTPSPERIARTELARFMSLAGKRSYEELHAWSVAHSEDFWSRVWDFCGVIGEKGARTLLDGERMPGARWFPDARLNFAENLLRRRDAADAIVFWGEDRMRRRLTFGQLHALVSRLAQALADAGVGKGDRVAGYLPNLPEATAAMLATTSLGAIWSSCSPDFGVQGVLDRFGQIEPKVLFCSDGYLYGGKEFDCQEKVEAVLARLPSVQECVVVDYLGRPPTAGTALYEFLDAFDPQGIRFEQVEFNHPLYILYSSGTTGVPKCIVHGTGGTLLQHVKEHRLHSDVKPGDRLFYFTTLGWMMWNWLVSGLASDATLLLYDGAPTVGSEEHTSELQSPS